MKHQSMRALALVLSLLLIIGCIPSIVSAEETTGTLYENGTVAYVAADGTVTESGQTYNAYKTLKEAMTALGEAGGTIYFTGKQTFEDISNRGAVSIIGVGEDASLKNKMITVWGNDLTLDNLTLDNSYVYKDGDGNEKTAVGGESAGQSRTNGKTLTFGANFKTKGPAWYGANSDWSTNPKSSAGTINFYGGTFGEGSAAMGYNNPFTVYGDTTYNYYGGEFDRIPIISRNGGPSNSSSNTKQTVNGDIYLNLNGGSFIDFYPATTTGILNGSVFVTVNGGTVNGAFSYTAATATSYEYDAPSVSGDYVFIFNNAEGLNLKTAKIGVDKVWYGDKTHRPVTVSGNKIIVSNHHESKDETGLNLDGNSADVVLTVSGGSAELVRDEETKLVTGYTLTADTNGQIPTIDGTEDTTYSAGKTYSLPAKTETQNVINIEFKTPTATTVYVKQSAETDGSGLSADSPVKTVAKAVEIAGTDKDFTILFLDDYTNDDSTNAAHTGTVTYSSTDTGSFQWSDFYLTGPVVFKDLRIKSLRKDGFINTRGHAFSIGTNVETLEGVQLPCFHIGVENTTTPFQSFKAESGQLGNVYIGSFYVSTGKSVNAEGAEITVDGTARIGGLMLGPDGYGDLRGDVIFTKPLTVLYNGGTIGSISRVSWGGKVTYQAGTRFIANNGLKFPSLPEVKDGDGDRYVIYSEAGGSVDVADNDTLNTFKITTTTGKIFIDGEEQTIASDDIYTLTAGTHTVTYYPTKNILGWNMSENDTLTVEETSYAAFSETSIPEKAGNLFIGWYNKNGVAVKDGDLLTKGDVLTANFMPIDTNDKNGTFYVEGAQVRLVGGDGLRFVSKVSADLFKKLKNSDITFTQETESSQNNAGLGFVVLPTNLLNGADLEKGTYQAETVPAAKIFSYDGNVLRYTVCITEISDYAREYTVRPYISFTNANGIKDTFYGIPYATSLSVMANTVLDKEADSLSDEQKATLKKYAGQTAE